MNGMNSRAEQQRAALAEDAMRLEAAWPDMDDAARRAIADVLAGVRRPLLGDDRALDVVIEDRPIGERVRIQIAAKAGGY